MKIKDERWEKIESSSCYNCKYMEPGNRGFCWHPSREDSDGDPGFSEVTAQREASGERCWCENYESRLAE